MQIVFIYSAFAFLMLLMLSFLFSLEREREREKELEDVSPFGFCGRSFAPFHDLDIAHRQGG